MGLSVALCEKNELLGGTLATSGGTVWLLGNHGRLNLGSEDVVESAETYVAALVADGANAANRPAFLSTTAEALDFLEQNTAVRFKVNAQYPDHRPDIPGAALGYRALGPVPFDARALDADFNLVRPHMPEYMILGGMIVGHDQIPHLVRPWRSVRSVTLAARLLLRYFRDRLTSPRGRLIYLGNALAARCVHSLPHAGIVAC